jgi:trypsin
MSLEGLIKDPKTNQLVPPARIVGGYEVDPPFKYSNAFVEIQRLGRHSCGGVLINPSTVITAAHCSLTDLPYDSVVVHRHDLNKSTKQENGTEYKVLSKLVHPEFVQSTFDNDIAIWKIKGNTTFQPKLKLDDGTLGRNYDKLFQVIGWGKTVYGGYLSPILLETKLPIYDEAQCVEDYKKNGETVNPDIKLCAGFPEGGKDACQGDSGGPFFTMEGDQMTLVGITSYGIGCARPNLPGTYTRISNFKDWILKNSQ